MTIYNLNFERVFQNFIMTSQYVFGENSQSIQMNTHQNRRKIMCFVKTN